MAGFSGRNRFNADMGGRAGSPGAFDASASAGQRGGNGAEQDSGVLGNVHSARGFRKALMKSGSKGNSLKDQLPDNMSFAAGKSRKPNYFAQGNGRHGMHIGAGAPFTAGADPTGAEF